MMDQPTQSATKSLPTTHSNLLRKSSSVIIIEPGDDGDGFSPIVAVCFTINYLVGTGFLCLPFAFYTGGTILSTITLLVVLLVSNITKNYVLETMARAEAMHDAGYSGDEDELDLSLMSTKSSSEFDPEYGAINPSSPSCFVPEEEESQGSNISTVVSSFEEESYLLAATGNVGAPPTRTFVPSAFYQGKDKEDRYAVKEIKFEYTELVHMFLGKFAEKIYIFAVSLTQYLALWGYTAVFSSAVAVQFPICYDFVADYNIYTLVYAAVVIPLSCLNLDEQVVFQLMLSACRFVLIFFMIYTAIRATYDTDTTYFVSQQEAEGAESVRFEGFYSMFSILVYSALFHNGIPVLSEPVADKKRLGDVFKATLVLCSVLFWTLGYFIANFFGHNVEQSTNLNWRDYVGGTGHPTRDDDQWSAGWTGTAIWAEALSFFVLVFPAINVVSSFPLNAIVLGNNLMAAVYEEDVHEYESNVKLRVLFRLLSSVPPILGAVLVRELGLITSYAGIFAIATAFVFPPLLYIQSKSMTEERGLKKRTCYEGLGSSIVWAICIFSLSSAAIAYVFVCLILGQ